MKNLFKIGGQLSQKQGFVIEIGGLIFFLTIWYILTYPISSNMINFSANQAKNPVSFQWSGPENFSSTFTGNDIITKAKKGEYQFTFQDSSKCSVKGKIVVPDKIDKPIVTVIKDSCQNTKLEVTVTVEKKQDGWILSKAIIPSPIKVITSFKELHFDDFVVRETSYSIFLNLLGYLEAIVLSLILGFIIGLIPFFRSLLNRYVNAIRFVPLTAVTGLFIFWFGIYINMKVQFLTFGIFVYLLPVVVQRIDEIEKVYLQTAYTLGASKWQMIKNVYWPHVTSKIIDDIRVLTAISWTYIIIAELLNNTGGVGALIYRAQKVDRYDKVFALLMVIVIIGILQDKLFDFLDKKLFPHKHIQKSK